MTRLSLWALPNERDKSRLAALSARLADAAGRAAVPPHITVTGSARSDMPEPVDPFSVRLTGVTDSDEPTRCITLTAEAAPPLLALRSAALTTGAAAKPYQPHVSLLYGTFDAERRAALKTLVDLTLPTTIEIVALSLVDTGAADHRDWTERSRIVLRAAG